MQKSTSIDTYALEFFLSLMETRSLAASADDFAVSSATAQRMLQKLRAHFADPLFTREGFAMRPTAKAERIAVKLRPLLAGLRRLGRDAEEDYSTRRETLRFAAYDNACASIFASLFPRLMARAPNLTLQFLQADERMFELLRAGDLDFVIYARQGLSPDLRSAALLTTPYVWVARKSHPLEAKARKNGFISPADAESFPQVIANAQPDRRRTPNGPAEGWFQPKHGRAPVLHLPFFLAAPYFLEGSDAL
ncbi:MAG: LysR family transcriptional regulator, partial [Sutterella wadsworthensis]|nr:LysR family transcriptional regulator [Sutterella wadsworthensis]